MTDTNIKSKVLGFAVIAFTLLGVLFGMNIMSFIFGNLGQAASSTFADVTALINNESASTQGVYAFVTNGSNYSIPPTAVAGFEGGFTVLFAINGSGGNESISVGNFTVDSASGIISGNETSNANWTNVLLTYNYNHKSSQEISANDVSNQSLQALSAYANQSTTQFSTLSIAITLIILLSVFAVFWFFFMGGSRRSSSGVSGGAGGNFN